MDANYKYKYRYRISYSYKNKYKNKNKSNYKINYIVGGGERCPLVRGAYRPTRHFEDIDRFFYFSFCLGNRRPVPYILKFKLLEKPGTEGYMGEGG